MELTFFRPKSEILQNYIEGYYFLTTKEDDSKVEYLTFPNNFSIISVMINTNVHFSENQATFIGTKNAPFRSDLICQYKKPIKIKYKGIVNELTFYFKPLGLNAFVEKPLFEYSAISFSDFFPFEDYESKMKEILLEHDIEVKIDLIENYWLAKLSGFQHSFLKEIVNDLTTSDKEYSIDELAKKHQTSRQNLSKQFEKHLCKTPSEFKKIHRFRETLKSQMNTKVKNNLTSLSYDLLFYDQSHLIKDFKSLTGFTPKTFFKNISPQENGEINWLFIS